MTSATLNHSVHLHEHLCELHLAVEGFWSLVEMQQFLGELDAAALPLVEAKKPIYVYGDFTNFVPQDSQTGEAIRDQLITARKFGLRRISIVGASALVKLQYTRLSDGVDVRFFDTRLRALEWLRADR